MSKHQQDTGDIWLFSPSYLATSVEQLEAVTMGKMQLGLRCLWSQHARWVQEKGAGQSGQRYDLVGHRLLAAQSVSGTCKWSFFHNALKRTILHYTCLMQLPFLTTTHAYSRAQRRGFTHCPQTLQIYCHDNSPEAWGEPQCELVSPEYILAATGEWMPNLCTAERNARHAGVTADALKPC